MLTAQINLTDLEARAIESLSETRGKTQEEILHEAIGRFVTENSTETRLAALRQARGMWRERHDLLDLANLRNEWNRL